RLAGSNMSESLPQLHMRRRLDALPELRVPAGYELRTFGPDDAAAWAELLAVNAELGAWGLERAAPYFAPGSRMVLAGSFFITHEGQPVATAQLHQHLDGAYAPTPELGWVAARPEHRGRGLGRVVCLAVLHVAAAAGHPEIFLPTDDHRGPAIRTYRGLGFEPWLFDPSAPARWARILAEDAG
ncbi:MAG TPA: GNAT family N-acetyltransferase, partial [Chloroflexota bacterium]|nr:GNAT family N-acetyltransferase [Chloroflexota bacterium]